MGRMAAMSIIVSDVWTRYSTSLLSRRLHPVPSEVPRSPGQASDLEGTLRPLDDLQLPALLFCQGAREFLDALTVSIRRRAPLRGNYQ
ncbi:hypothetical protein V9K92_02415 [Phyllobacterium sp. CCNWLW109]|uniref:hypothetical protein n=1 Tax=Phyllobacterium sp. CCNWLW109 TaxID=3127479 RepID=UPI003076E6B8